MPNMLSNLKVICTRLLHRNTHALQSKHILSLFLSLFLFLSLSLSLSFQYSLSHFLSTSTHNFAFKHTLLSPYQKKLGRFISFIIFYWQFNSLFRGYATTIVLEFDNYLHDWPSFFEWYHCSKELN